MGLRSYKPNEEIEIGDIVVCKTHITEVAFMTVIITGIRAPSESSSGYAMVSRPHMQASGFDTRGGWVAMEDYEIALNDIRVNYLVFDRDSKGTKDNRRMGGAR